MRTALVLVVLALAPAARSAPRPALRMGLVQAYCGTVSAAPCAPAFGFTAGEAVLFAEHEPGPTCPRTGQVTEAKAGVVSLTGLKKNGTPFSGQLPVETTLKTSFGNGPGCPLSGVPPFQVVSLTATLTCRAGHCKGVLLPIQCLPKSCAGTRLTSEFVSLVVHDDSGDPTVALATPGLVVAPTRR
jgi:hypothetical protein